MLGYLNKNFIYVSCMLLLNRDGARKEKRDPKNKGYQVTVLKQL